MIVADGSTDSLFQQFTGNLKLKLCIQGATKSKLTNFSKDIDNVKLAEIEKIKNGHVVLLEYNQENDPRKEIFNYIIKTITINMIQFYRYYFIIPFV